MYLRQNAKAGSIGPNCARCRALAAASVDARARSLLSTATPNHPPKARRTVSRFISLQ
jgi:hypothetical protein